MVQANNVRNRRRLQLILILGVFAVPPLVAVVLGAMGWRPGTAGHGQPVFPQRSVAVVTIPLADGGQWPWVDPEKPRMTLVALPGPDCARACVDTLALMRNAHVSLGKKQDRLRLLYLGTLPEDVSSARFAEDWTVGSDPDGALAEFRSRTPDSVAALLVESNGTVLSRYPAGFDPNGLRKDLDQVMRR